jgi:hypothetical protein
MGFSAVNATEITGLTISGTADFTGTWNTNVDLDTYVTVPNGATSVVLKIDNTSSSTRRAQIRYPGATTHYLQDAINRYQTRQNFVVPLASGNLIDLYLEATTVKFYVVGFFDSAVTAFHGDTFPIISIPGSGTRTLTAPTEVPSNATAMLVRGGALSWWRPTGETVYNVSGAGPTWVKLDGSKQFEVNTTSSGTMTVLAYATGGFNWQGFPAATNAPTKDDTYRTSGVTYSGKSGVILQPDAVGAITQAYNFRRTGDSGYTYNPIESSTTQKSTLVALNASGQFDYIMDSTATAANIDVQWSLDEFSSASLTITSVTPSTFDDGKTGIVIAGSGFGASQGSSTLTIGAQTQTVTQWSDTSITFTSVRGSVSPGNAALKLTKG